MKRGELRSLVRSFRNGILEARGGCPDNMCFVVCHPLSGYLQFLGVAHSLVEGTFLDCHHYWIELPDRTVIDPTADQFERGFKVRMPKVYIGPRREWYAPYTPAEKREHDAGVPN